MPKRWSTSREGCGSPLGGRGPARARGRGLRPDELTTPDVESSGVGRLPPPGGPRADARACSATLGCTGRGDGGSRHRDRRVPGRTAEAVPRGRRARAERPPSSRARRSAIAADGRARRSERATRGTPGRIPSSRRRVRSSSTRATSTIDATLDVALRHRPSALARGRVVSARVPRSRSSGARTSGSRPSSTGCSASARRSRTTSRASPAIGSSSRRRGVGGAFGLVDTAGYLQRADRRRGAGGRAGGIGRSTRRTSSCSSSTCTTGITRRTPGLARRLRTAPTPVLVVANKADGPADIADVAAFHRLGLGEPVPGVGPARARDRASCWTACSSCCPTRRCDRGPGPRASVRDRRPAERRQVEPVQPARRGRAQRRLRGRRHDAGQRRLARDVAGSRPGAIRRHRRHAPRHEGARRRVLQRAARPRGDRARRTWRCSSSMPPTGFPVEDKKIANLVMDAGRGAAARREQMGSGRGQGPVVQAALRTRCSSTRGRRSCGRPRVRGQGCAHGSRRCCSTSTRGGARARTTSTVNEIIQAAQRERPDAAANGQPALRDAGRRPHRRRS